MSFQFLITEGAKGDMVKCQEADSYAAAKLSVVLRDLVEDRIACEALVDDQFRDSIVDSVEPLWSLHDKRINAYRVRVVDVAAWRLITCVDHRRRRVGLFAVMPRHANYQDDPILWPRIECEYDSHDFPRY